MGFDDISSNIMSPEKENTKQNKLDSKILFQQQIEKNMKFRDKYDFNNSIDDGGMSTIRNSPRYFGNNYNHKISLADLD
jgi:hypothetical protein